MHALQRTCPVSPRCGTLSRLQENPNLRNRLRSPSAEPMGPPSPPARPDRRNPRIRYIERMVSEDLCLLYHTWRLELEGAVHPEATLHCLMETYLRNLDVPPRILPVNDKKLRRLLHSFHWRNGGDRIRTHLIGFIKSAWPYAGTYSTRHHYHSNTPEQGAAAKPPHPALDTSDVVDPKAGGHEQSAPTTNYHPSPNVAKVEAANICPISELASNCTTLARNPEGARSTTDTSQLCTECGLFLQEFKNTSPAEKARALVGRRSRLHIARRLNILGDPFSGVCESSNQHAAQTSREAVPTPEPLEITRHHPARKAIPASLSARSTRSRPLPTRIPPSPQMK